MSKLDWKKLRPYRPLLIAALAAAFLGWILYSYIYNNQPGCPQCGNANEVVYTYKSYEQAPQETFSLERFGPIGFCRHTGGFAGAFEPHFCWYCYRCQKRIIKPPNWRQKG